MHWKTNIYYSPCLPVSWINKRSSAIGLLLRPRVQLLSKANRRIFKTHRSICGDVNSTTKENILKIHHLEYSSRELRLPQNNAVHRL